MAEAALPARTQPAAAPVAAESPEAWLPASVAADATGDDWGERLRWVKQNEMVLESKWNAHNGEVTSCIMIEDNFYNNHALVNLKNDELFVDFGDMSYHSHFGDMAYHSPVSLITHFGDT